MKKEKKPKKTGRPPWKPTEDDIRRAEKYAAHGLSKDHIACFFDKNRDTIFQRINDTPEFSDAIKKGEATAAERLLTAYWERVSAGSDACIIFGLKTRLNWKETQVIENTGKDGEPVQHEIKMSEKETDKRLREMMHD